MIIRRGLRMRPVSEFASLTGHPVDPAAAPLAVEDEGHQHVLRGVLRPLKVGGHLPGRGHHRRIGVMLSGLGHQRGAVSAELGHLAGRPQQVREFVVTWHGRSLAPGA